MLTSCYNENEVFSMGRIIMFFGKKKKDKKEEIDLEVEEDNQVEEIEVVLGDKSDLEISEVGDMKNDIRHKDA
jgi:hypothetical protein